MYTDPSTVTDFPSPWCNQIYVTPRIFACGAQEVNSFSSIKIPSSDFMSAVIIILCFKMFWAQVTYRTPQITFIFWT